MCDLSRPIYLMAKGSRASIKTNRWHSRKRETERARRPYTAKKTGAIPGQPRRSTPFAVVDLIWKNSSLCRSPTCYPVYYVLYVWAGWCRRFVFDGLTPCPRKSTFAFVKRYLVRWINILLLICGWFTTSLEAFVPALPSHLSALVMVMRTHSLMQPLDGRLGPVLIKR